MPRLPIRSLEKDIFDQLKAEEVIYIPYGSRIRHVPLLFRGSVILIVVLFLAYDFRWSSLKIVLLSLVILAGSFAFVVGFTALLSKWRNRYPEGVSITKETAVFIKDALVDWFPLTELISVDYSHQYKARIYQRSAVSFQFSDETFIYPIDDRDSAESIVDSVLEAKNKALARSVSGDVSSRSSL